MSLRRSLLSSLCMIALSIAGNTLACDYPRSPSVPEGESATREEMLAAQKTVRAYLASAEAYLQCLESMEYDPEDPASTKQAEINLKRYNAMVEEMHRVSDDYNIAVRTYNSRQ